MNLEQLIQNLPSSRINNSREIVRSKVAKFNKQPSESRAMEIESLIGASFDFSDSDWGNEPEALTNN
jgi:hypothetical protein